MGPGSVQRPVDTPTPSGPARSFEQLNRAQLLKEGATIWIVSDLGGSGEYGQITAEFVSLTETTISVLIDSLPIGGTDLDINAVDGKHRVELPEDRVGRIEGKLPDSLTNGAVLGAVIGFGATAIPAGISAANCPGKGIIAQLCIDDGLALGIAAMGGIVGAVIGAVVDASLTKQSVLYAAPGVLEGGVAISFLPMATRERRGFLFTLEW